MDIIADLVNNALGGRLPVDLGTRLLSGLMQQLLVTNHECSYVYLTLGPLQREIDALVGQVSLTGAGEYVHAMVNFNKASDGDAQNALYILNTLQNDTSFLWNALFDSLGAIMSGLTKLYQYLNAANEPSLQRSFNPDVLLPEFNEGWHQDMVTLYNNLQNLSGTLSKWSEQIAQELSTQLKTPRKCVSGVTPGDNQSGPPILALSS